MIRAFLSLLLLSVAHACSRNVELVYSAGQTKFQFDPIVVKEQNKDSVKFLVRNPFRNTEKMFVQFDEIKEQKWDFQTGDSVCYSEEDVAHEEQIEYTAYCMPGNPISIVNLWLSDRSIFSPEFDNAKVPDGCVPDPEDSNPKVQYTFLVQCEDACSNDVSSTPEQRKLYFAPKVEDKIESSPIKKFLRRPRR